MRLLEQQHAQEEHELLGLPSDGRHMAVSAPTTPPRIPSVHGDRYDFESQFDPKGPHLLPAFRSSLDTNGPSGADPQTMLNEKRSSANYGPISDHITRAIALHGGQNYVGAKSMPASRRGSSGSRDGDDILIHGMQGLSVQDPSTQTKPQLRQAKTTARFGDVDYSTGYNAGLMLDDELDKDIHRKSNDEVLRIPSEQFSRRHQVFTQL